MSTRRKAPGKDPEGKGQRPRPRRIEAPQGQVEALPLVPVCPYFEEGNALWWNKAHHDGTVPVALSTFAARIVEEVIRDDGETRVRFYVIEGRFKDGREPDLEVSATSFSTLGWASELGSRAVVLAGQGTKDHFRAAVLLLSDPVRRQVFTHTGWREIGGTWCYLHGGGALGAEGPLTGIETDLPKRLALYALPAPLSGEALRRAWESSRSMMDLGRTEVTPLLWIAAFRAAVKECPFSIHVSGTMGSGKSELAALVVRTHDI